MTTVIERYSAASFSSASKRVGSLILPTYQAATKTELQLGRDANTARANIADPTKPASVVGTPVYHDQWMELSSTGWLNSNVLDNPALTLILISRFNAGTNGWLITQFGGGAPFTSIDFQAATVRGFAADSSGQSGFSGGTVPAASNYWTVTAMRTVPTGSSYTWKLDAFKAGASIDSDTGSIAQTRVAGSGNFAIGSAFGGSSTGDWIGVAFAAIIHSAMSDADLLTQAANLSTYYTPLGIAC